jgi:hypothetical protein
MSYQDHTNLLVDLRERILGIHSAEMEAVELLQ